MTADAIINLVFRAKNLAEKEIGQVKRDLEEVRKKSEALKTAGKKIATAGAALSVGLAPVTLALKDSIGKASDLNETISKTEAVFLDAGAGVLAWSENTADGLGLSQRAALEYASGFGNLLQQIGGQSVEESAVVSQSLTALSADLNSFFNRDDSSQAIFSALTGEFEPLKKFGVILNEATLKAKALEMGLYDGKGALESSAKQAATLSLIFEQTSTAQGDFAKTKDQDANSTRRLNAAYEDMLSKLGNQLLPIKLELTRIVAGLVTRFSQLSPGVQRFIAIALGLLAVLGPIVTAVGALVFAWGAILPVLSAVGAAIAGVGLGPLVVIIGAVAAAVGWLVLAWKVLAPVVKKVVAAVVNTVREWVAENGPLIDRIKEAWNALKDGAMKLFNAVKAAFAQIAAAITAELDKTLAPFGGVDQVMKDLMTVAGVLLESFLTMAGGLLSSAAENLPQIVAFIVSVIETIGEFVRVTLEMPGLIKAALVGLAADFKDFGVRIIEGLIEGLKSKIDEAVNVIKGLGEKAKAAFSGVMGIFSPSRVFMEYGRFLMAGLTLGILGGTGEAVSAVEKAAVQVRTAGAGGLQVQGGGFGAATADNGFGSLQSAGATPTFDVANQQDPTEQEAQRIAEALRASNLEASTLRGTFDGLSGSIEGLINGTMTWNDAVMNVANSIVTELITSFARMAAAWITEHLFMAAVTQATNAETAASGAAAATVNSIASYGAAAAIGAVAVIAALAMVAGAFQDGGYTGNAGVSTFAGVVHGQEFVNNASSTSQNRAFLEYLNEGGSAADAMGAAYETGRSSGGQAVNVIIVDSMSRAERMSHELDGEVRIVVRDEMERRRT